MDFLNDKEFLGEIRTVEEKNLILSEIVSIKRKDFDSVRKSFLDLSATLDLDNLSKKLNNLETVKIVLPIFPTVGIMELFDNFFTTNLNKKVLYDFELDKEIIAGFRLVYHGKYFDASI